MGRLPFDLEIEDIAELAEIISKNDLGEIRLEDNDCGEKLVIKGKRPCPPPPPAQAPIMPMGIQTAAPAQPAAPAAPAAPAQEKAPEGKTVKAPIVGTFYASPSPEKPPFVTVGQKVNKGDVLMIIESMKLMNEVQSEYSGTVKEILVQNGQAVEYDQPIMIID